MNFSMYDLTTGVVTSNKSLPTEQEMLDTLSAIGNPNRSYVSGSFPVDASYIKGGEVYDLPERPDKWSVWDLASETWRDQRTQAEKDAYLTAQINAERDRRLPLPFEFNGVLFDRDPVSLSRINGAGTLALGAIVNGAQPGDLSWHGGPNDFGWISYDGSIVTMDAQTVFAFGQAAAERETLLVFAAKALKSMDPIPANCTDDTYWP